MVCRRLSACGAKLLRVPARIRSMVARRMAGVTFAGVEGNRSDSDNGQYVAFVEKAARDYGVFSRFKASPVYQQILEHVSCADGAAYLEIICKEAPDLYARMDDFKDNDLIGAPTVYDYDGVGTLSPTTLRYVKVAADLKNLFGDKPLAKVVEIGGGYGGQLLVLDKVFRIKEYHLFDLPPVLELAARYLEAHLLKLCYRTWTLNRFGGEEVFDLAISNYAFSELPAPLQRLYVEKVLGKAKRGYLTMNSGRVNSAHNKGKLTLKELEALLPAFEVMEERPATSSDNYILVWGHAKR